MSKKLSAVECYDARDKKMKTAYITKKGFPTDAQGEVVYTITFTDYVKEHSPNEIAKKYGLKVADAANIKLAASKVSYKKLLDETKPSYKVEVAIDFEDEDGMEANAVDYGMLRLPIDCIERLRSLNKKKGR